ncbi:MAG: hypothetical protein ACR2IF_15280 [Terriglobales bacterium]
MLILLLLLICGPGWAQKAPPAPAASTPEISGMYTFLRDGEFVEIDVNGDKVTGFISRYGELESDRGAFLDHMFTKGALNGNHITFATRAVHGVSYEFQGKVERGEAKAAGAEGYYVIRGTLTETTTDKDKKASARARELVMKSFPADALAEPRKKD